MLGLVLEGGGAKGAFHAGAISALTDNGYKFNGVMGTSIGAFNGAFVAQDDCNLLSDLWSNLVPSAVLDLDDDLVSKLLNRDLNRDTLNYFFKTAAKTIKSRGFATDKAFAFMKKYIDEDKIRKSNIDYGIVTVSLTDNFTPIEIFKEDIPLGDLHSYILASAYFPALKLERINGKYFIDGGIYDNLPITPLVRRGYDEIFAVRTMSIMPHKKVYDQTVKINYIIPSEPLGRTVSFTNDIIKKNMKLGYYDTLKVLKNYDGRLYYFVHMSEGDFITFMQERFSEDTFKKMAVLLNINTENKFAIITAVCNKLQKELKLQETSKFETFAIFLESFAWDVKIEKFATYDFASFLNILLDKLAFLNSTQSEPAKIAALKLKFEKLRESFLDKLINIFLENENGKIETNM